MSIYGNNHDCSPVEVIIERGNELLERACSSPGYCMVASVYVLDRGTKRLLTNRESPQWVPVAGIAGEACVSGAPTELAHTGEQGASAGFDPRTDLDGQKELGQRAWETLCLPLCSLALDEALKPLQRGKRFDSEWIRSVGCVQLICPAGRGGFSKINMRHIGSMITSLTHVVALKHGLRNAGIDANLAGDNPGLHQQQRQPSSLSGPLPPMVGHGSSPDQGAGTGAAAGTMELSDN